jgi:hypothetical protein
MNALEPLFYAAEFYNSDFAAAHHTLSAKWPQRLRLAVAPGVLKDLLRMAHKFVAAAKITLHPAASGRD